jgi:hypothetical protein
MHGDRRGWRGFIDHWQAECSACRLKAGAKPSAIARQFGISQSDVRKALAQASVEKPDLMSKDRTAPTGYQPMGWWTARGANLPFWFRQMEW